MLSRVWELKVRFGETDPAGIVFYPNYYKWMDQASSEMFGPTEMATKKILPQGKGVPLVEAHCRFRRPLYYDDHVRVESQVCEVRDKVFKIEHRFYRDGELTAEGYEMRAWVEFTDGRIKSTAIPESVRRILMSDAAPQ